MNINQVVEAGLKLLLSPIRTKQDKSQSVWDTDDYKNTMAYLDTLANKSGKPIPDNEDGREARTEKYL